MNIQLIFTVFRHFFLILRTKKRKSENFRFKFGLRSAFALPQKADHFLGKFLAAA